MTSQIDSSQFYRECAGCSAELPKNAQCLACNPIEVEMPLHPSADAIPVVTDAAPLPNPDLVGLSVTINASGDYVIHKTGKPATVTVELSSLERFNSEAANELAGAVATSDRAQKVYRFCKAVDIRASLESMGGNS